MEKNQTPVVVESMDLQAIVEALAPVSDPRNRQDDLDSFEGDIHVVLSPVQYKAVQNVVAMFQLADLVNYKRAQDSYPRLLNAVKLVLAIADHPEQNPAEKISLAPKTRAQLDSALKFAEK